MLNYPETRNVLQIIMTLSIRNTKQAFSLLDNILNNPRAYQNALAVAHSAGKQVANYLGGNPALSFPTTSPIPNNMVLSQITKNSSRQSKRGRGRRSSRKSANQGLNPSKIGNTLVPRPVAYRPRITFTFILTPTSSAGGAVSQHFWPGYKNTGITYSMQSQSSQYQQMAAIFNYQTLHSIRAEFQPIATYTTSGTVALSIYEDPTTTPALSSLQNVMQKDSAVMADIKERCCLCWKPTDEQQKETKECADASGLTGGILRNFAPCILGIYVTSNLVSAAVGNIIVEVDLTFTGLG